MKPASALAAPPPPRRPPLPARQVGVLLVEPQWGSSVAAMPWPPALLRDYISAAKARGIAVIADEIMCGLGRHGAEPAAGGTGCFLSECWDLQPDILTFGKGIGGGAGHLLSGAVVLEGASKLQGGPAGTAYQSHTYAGSSARALANGAALLASLEKWRPSVRAIEAAVAPIAAELNEASGGAVLAHGQGALWGGLFAHPDPQARTAANLEFKRLCAEACGPTPRPRRPRGTPEERPKHVRRRACCPTLCPLAASCLRRATTTTPTCMVPLSGTWPIARCRRRAAWVGRRRRFCPSQSPHLESLEV